MLWYILILWVLVYVFLILKDFLYLKKLIKLLEIMVEYLDSATIINSFNLCKKENYDKCLNELLFNFPAIKRYTSIYSKTLEYGCPDIDNYCKTYELYNELLMKRNFLTDVFFKSFNPIYALKTLFCIPSTFVKWLGFHPKNSISKILSLICWIITWFFNSYSNEIKTLISSLF